MVFYATLNNISVLSWGSVLLVEKAEVPGAGENHRPVTSHWQTLSHNVVSSTPHHEWGSALDWDGARGKLNSHKTYQVHLTTGKLNSQTEIINQWT